MGALHDGHLQLVDQARARADVVVLSLFVNPLQFAPTEDLARYPRNFARDCALAESRGVTLLFAPTVAEMYAAGDDVRVTAGPVGNRWEGASRPGHFDGVLTVVAKLFNIVNPDVACFGQKDIQQVTLVGRMIRQLDFPIELIIVPTVREPDGLALSSRNVYLSADDRHDALALSRGLLAALAAWRAGERDASALAAVVGREIAGVPGVVADYIAVVDPLHLAPVVHADAGTIVALAARVGATRLIDNVILEEHRS
jgi:pantoate--beta-alanine ligase